ncbi:MAG: cyclase family protein [Bacteroidota bacterium]
MSLIDITRTLNPTIATWEGDTPFELKRILALNDGESINLTTLVMSVHTGTHMDAPYHFDENGLKVEEMDLLPYWGTAQVVYIPKKEGPLLPEDFRHLDLTLAPRILIKSASSGRDPQVFYSDYVYPHPLLASFLAEKGIVLFGSDAPSMDHVKSKTLEGHHALHAQHISILEGLELAGVAEGMYELSALPLKIQGGDGSPVRAVLREL